MLALEQGHTDFRFQCLNALAQRGLRNIQCMGCPAKVGVVDQCQQVLKAARSDNNNLLVIVLIKRDISMNC